MIGLLSKDLSIMRKQFRIMILVLVFYAVWAFYEKNTMMFAYMAVLFGFFMPLTAIGFDERAQWNKYALCMPVKKSYVAISKYILGFLGITTGVISFYILTAVIDSSISFEQFKIGLALLSLGMTLVSIYLPICFQFGTERARYVIIVLGIIPCILVIALNKTGKLVEPSKDTLTLLLNLAPILALLIVVISCMISVRIIQHKEY